MSSFLKLLLKRLADETFVNDGLVDLLELLHDVEVQLATERKQVCMRACVRTGARHERAGGGGGGGGGGGRCSRCARRTTAPVAAL